MSSLTRVASVGVLALSLLCGWAIAQNSSSKGLPDRAGDGNVGRYTVAASGQGAILLDSTSGKTWTLVRNIETASAAWLPLDRVEEPAEVEEWISRQREAARSAAEREHEERRSERLGKKPAGR
ncbi:MAG: hypothetical protein EHM42_14390 [Planctomycetaceae bacterium]|nr:MAG: hypothetical protein EHM42_14390 [Planctomycetaceae bacterium]